jgi:hypothetical protein
MKKLITLPLLGYVIYKITEIIANRPRNCYYEFFNPSVVLVSKESLHGAVVPSRFAWTSSIDEIWYDHSIPTKQLVEDSCRLNHIGALHIDLQTRLGNPYEIIIKRLWGLYSTDTNILIVADAKTIARVRRNAHLWSPLEDSMFVYPISRQYSRADYMAA